MTNENLNVNNEAQEGTPEVAAKPKRVRKAPVKIQKTATEIIDEINLLNHEKEELEGALAGLAADNVAYAIVEKAFVAKREEYEIALNQVYTI